QSRRNLPRNTPLDRVEVLETLQLAQESRKKMKQMNKEIKPANYTKINHLSEVFVPQKALSREELCFSNNSKTANVSKSFLIPNEDLSDDTTPSVARKSLNEASSAHQELHKIIKDENFPIVNQVDARLQNFEIQFLKKADKFVGDFKSLANEADASLAKHKALELEIKCLLKAVVNQDIMIIMQIESVVDTSDLQTELERTKERFENRIIKKETEYAKLWNDWYKKYDECKYDKISYDKAYKDKQQKIERLQAQLGDLKVTSNSVSTPQEPKSVNNDKVIAPGMFRINPSKSSREEKHVSNIFSASAKTEPITVSQPHVITKKDMNSDLNGLSYTGVDNTKTRRPQPRSNTKNDRDVISKFVYAMCNKWLISVNRDKCLSNYVIGKNSHGKNQKAKVSVKEIQKKYQAKVAKPKKAGTHESLATPKPRKSRLILRWSPTGKMFNQEGKLVDLSESKSKSDCSNGDNACTSNILEPKIKRFPNSTSLLDRLFKFVYVRFENDHVAAILGFGDLQWGNILIVRVYFVEGLGHNLFLVGQFCDSDLEVAFRRNACFVSNLKGVDLLKGDQAARTMLIFSRAPLFLWVEAIATACFIQNRSIIHRRFNKTPYELINDRKPNISFLHVFGALCYPKNDRKDIGKLGRKGDIGFFIGYSADFCAYRVYNRWTKKIMETMNVSFDELSAMAFEQRSSKPRLNSMTSGQISSGLDLTYAPYSENYSAYSRSSSSSVVNGIYNNSVAPIQIHSSSHATNVPITSQDVDELHPNAMFDGNTFVNLFANPSTSAASASSSQQNMDPSNMHTNQLRSDGDMCMYALSGSTLESKNVKEAMTDPAWIDSMQEELLQFKRLDVWVLVPAPDNISPLTLKWLFKNKHDEEQTSKYVLEIRNKYGMESCDPVGTPMEIKDKLDLDQNGTPVDATKYRSMIGAFKVSYV
nr:hypothetical protein [Tanacetum cinerariifolium]